MFDAASVRAAVVPALPPLRALVAVAGLLAALASCADSKPPESGSGTGTSPPRIAAKPAPTVDDSTNGEPPRASDAPAPVDIPAVAEQPASKLDKDGYLPLFDGTLASWQSTKFGGEGDVAAVDQMLVLSQGNDMTGVTTTRKDLPTSNYEIEWEAKRVQGNDFFGTLTFPVKKDACSLVLGGWGGGVVGLSSVNGFDASENDTSGFHEFEKDRWYKVRLRVTDDRISAWIDDKQVVDMELADRTISIRIECELSRPLGFSTWRTTGALRNIRLKTLTPKAP